MSYESLCANGFGEALAEQVIDENGTALTIELKQRAVAAWNITSTAMNAVFRRCEQLLADPLWVAAYRND